jgi:hypothetical protein
MRTHPGAADRLETRRRPRTLRVENGGKPPALNLFVIHQNVQPVNIKDTDQGLKLKLAAHFPLCLLRAPPLYRTCFHERA